MLEERKLYLEEHPTKGNGYYIRDLLTLFGPLEDLKVPRVREGDFHPKLLPYRRRTSIELSEGHLPVPGDSVPRLRDQAGWSQGDLRVLAVRGGRGVGQGLASGGASSKWQLCVLHTVRDTLAKVRKKDREAMAQDLKGIWRADTVKQAHRALRALEEKWAGKYPELMAKWLDKRPSRSS